MSETTTNAAVPESVRSKLAIALDVDDLVEARRIARDVMPWFGVAKVGLELYSATGPDAVAQLTELGMTVFLDLKLHDIPTTRAALPTVVGMSWSFRSRNTVMPSSVSWATAR